MTTLPTSEQPADDGSIVSIGWGSPHVRRVVILQLALILASVLIMGVVWSTTVRLERRTRLAKAELEKADQALQTKNAMLREAGIALESSKKALEETQKLIGSLAQTKGLSSELRREAQSTLESTQKAEHQVTATIKNVAAPPTRGYSFYGLFDGSRWLERYFERVSGDGDSLPQVGDVCRARGDVNVRSGYIRIDDGQWKNRSDIGTLHRGDRVRVIAVTEVVPGYVWIEFAGVS